jgi:hypothetical protein
VSSGQVGIIDGSVDGIEGVGRTNVANSADIFGGFNGIHLFAGGAITNAAGAIISGNDIGVLISGGNATITDAGTISGGTYAVQFGGGGNHKLILDPGAVLTGKVAGGGTGVLVLASAAGVGTISGLGSQFAGFKTVTENAGAKWSVTGVNSLAAATKLAVNGTLTDAGRLTAAGPVTVKGVLQTSGTGTVQLRDGLTLQSGATLATAAKGSIEVGTKGGAAKGVVTVDAGATLVGAGTIKSAIVDSGTIVVSGGTLTLASSISGAGSVSISSHSVLSAAGQLGVSKLAFLAGGSETATLGVPTNVGATIAGFIKSDTIDLVGFTATKLAFAGHTLTVDGTGGSVAHLNFAGTYKLSQFAFSSDHHGGTNITHA